MKLKWTLRTFLVAVTVLGIATCLTWEHFLLNPVKLDRVLLGPITSGGDHSIEPLNIDELKFAIDRQKTNRESAKTISLVVNAKIEEFESLVDPPRDVPLIGRSELRRTVYKCTVDGKSKDGTTVKRIFYVEKNHFHLLE